MKLLGMGGLSVSWAELRRRRKTGGISISTPLVLPLPPSLPGGHWLVTPCCSLGSVARCWHALRLPSSPGITRKGGGVSLFTIPQREQPPLGGSRAGGGLCLEGAPASRKKLTDPCS